MSIRRPEQIDRRSRSSRYLGVVRGQLFDLVGGEPDIAERELIERAAMLSLMLAHMDKEIKTGISYKDADVSYYLDCVDTYKNILNMLPKREDALCS